MKKDSKSKHNIRIGKYVNTLVYIFFISYILFMIWRLFFYAYGNYHRIQGSGVNMNIIPFKTITNYIKGIGRLSFNVWLYNLLGNIVVFMPLGVMMPIISTKLRNLKRVILWSLASVFLVELLQMYFRVGTFDIDDVILNITGVTIGYFITILIRKKNVF